MFFLFIWFFLTICFLCFIRFRQKRARLYKLMEQFDGPTGIPILGNVLDFKNDTQKMIRHLIENYIEKFDDTFKIWLLHVPFVVVFKPEDIQILSAKNLEKDNTYKFLADLLGDGLITCSMADWRRRRKIVNPAFHGTHLIKNVINIFNSQHQATIESLRKECDSGKEFDIWPFIVTGAFKIVCEFTMGNSLQTRPDIMKKYDTILYKEASIMVAKRIYKPWLYPAFMFNIHKFMTGKRQLIQKVQSAPQQILREKRMGQLPKQRNAEGKEIKDLIDIIGQAKGNTEFLNDAEVLDEILTIIFAGTETSAITISLTLLFLAMKADIQDKVNQEIKEIFGDSDRMPDAEDLEKMILLGQCIKETLRWITIVAIMIRSSKEEIRLSDGRIIPVGAKIVIAAFMTHHDKNIYPDPYTWNPDNFLPEKEKARVPNAFIAFGFGLRSCAGSKYAMMTSKISISSMLRKYKLRTSLKYENEIHLDVDFALRSAIGYPIELQSRNHN